MYVCLHIHIHHLSFSFYPRSSPQASLVQGLQGRLLSKYRGRIASEESGIRPETIISALGSQAPPLSESLSLFSVRELSSSLRRATIIYLASCCQEYADFATWMVRSQLPRPAKEQTSGSESVAIAIQMDEAAHAS